jgi:hypothetical protein
MRKAFTALILCLAVLYTYVAFAGLSFLSSTGRLGPGFFPRIIGILLIVACLYDFALGWQREGEAPLPSEHARTTAVMAALTVLFALSLNVLGGYIGMIAFLLLSLLYLNRDHPIQNVTIALLLPTAIWLMFDRWLNASFPEGVILPRLFA